MKCPHCGTGIKLAFEKRINSYESEQITGLERNENWKGFLVSGDNCPECKKFIVILETVECPRDTAQGVQMVAGGHERYVKGQEIIYPKYVYRKVEPEVPDSYKGEFLEACAVLMPSPKASAALSRRILQTVLQEEFHIKHDNLAREIDEFIKKPGVPTYLTRQVDAIRSFGNFAAHPTKNTNTGEIVEVEVGESEWLLDVLEALFDFAFVQPEKLEQNQKNLNEKLQNAGKPPMKV